MKHTSWMGSERELNRVNPFASEQALNQWLKEQGIETDRWLAPGTKGVADLWLEIVTGDARLQQEPPLRLVNVVQVIIRRGDRILVEAEQELDDESKRARNTPPSEKMKPGESVVAAATRCLQEELGVESGNVSWHTATIRRSQRVTDSPSYPGLPTRYTFHSIEATVEGLPDGDFWHENLAFADGHDPIRRHRWAWRLAR